MKLVWPSREYLASYVVALERGWSPDNIRGRITAEEELKRIAEDADAFLASMIDREAAGPPLTMLDGTKVPRIPGYRKWMWDGEFCGSIGFRWQPGTEALPPYCLGHVGYAVVPWKQGRGYATAALREIVNDAANEGLRFVMLTTAPDNVASQCVIEKNCGAFIGEFTTPPELGSKRERRYCITTRLTAFASCVTCDRPLGFDANCCIVCHRVFCSDHCVIREGVANCADCEVERRNREAAGVGDADVERIVARVAHDVQATLGSARAAIVEETAARLRLFEDRPQELEQKVVDDVQQYIHDGFIDTTWPSCPHHPNHPLWFSGGWWQCPEKGRVAKLGELASA